MKDIQITPVEQSVDLIRIGEKQILLIGTAHVSKESAAQVERIITETKPDTVALELCDSRFETISNEDKWKQTDIIKVIKDGKIYVLGAQLMLSSIQKRIANKFGIKPGEEIRRALALAKESGATISLVDRDVKTTLKRAWAGMTPWAFSKMLIGGLFASGIDDIDESTIEDLKSSGSISDLIAEFGKELPSVKEALIDERDLYLAQKIKDSPGKKIVAVVGAGHMDGIKKAIHKETNLQALETIPKSHPFFRYSGYILPALFVLILLAGFFTGDASVSWDMIKAWALTCGTLAAIGAAISLAHPVTIISAFFAAPFTALNPAIAVGTVTALVEAWFKKPLVTDFETVSEDIASLKGLWSNRVTRVFVVFFLSSLGGAIGNIMGVTWMAKYL